MSRISVAAVARVMLALALLAASFARAQDSLEDRLTGDRIAPVLPGVYVAGDKVGFSLDSLGHEFLFRMDGTPEVFVLYENRATLGERVLKYDSGETAIRVQNWGSMTLYTDAQPGGLPAERTGDSVPPQPPQVSISEVQSAAGDESQRLAYIRRLNIAFSADWNALAADMAARSFGFDTLENAARGLDRFATSQAARDALAKRVSSVLIQEGSKPLIEINGKTLVVTFNPGRGFEGRASSRAIARALGQMFFGK